MSGTMHIQCSEEFWGLLKSRYLDLVRPGVKSRERLRRRRYKLGSMKQQAEIKRSERSRFKPYDHKPIRR